MRTEWSFIYENLSPLYTRMLCAKIGLNWPSGSGEEDFLNLNLLMYFHCFIFISPWKRVWPFIWTNFNPPHPRILCAMFGWNWSSGCGEEDFFKFVSVFLVFNCGEEDFLKELGPRTANMALSICLKMKMIEKVLRSDYSANESLLILCLWLWRHFLTGSCIMTP